MPEIWEKEPILSGLVAQSGVADTAGTLQYQPATQGDAGTVAFAGPISDFIQYGVVNGAFAQGPFGTDSDIDPINNPLPYWAGPTQLSGGAITARWIVDATVPSGYSLQLTINPGAASDEAYFEQIVPISGSYARVTGHVARAVFYLVSETGAGANVAKVKITTRYLDATGAALGSDSTSFSLSDAAAGVFKSVFTPYALSASPLATALYLRVRIGVERNTLSAAETTVVNITDVRVDSAKARVLVAEDSDPATYAPGVVLQTGGQMNFIPDGDTSQQLALGNGLMATVLPTSLQSTLTVTGLITATAGQISFPSTQNPSADANTLDDYEEGTWTPALTFVTVGDQNIVLSTAAGAYTKIGRLVNVRCRVVSSTFTFTTSAGALRITGLPFTVATSAPSGVAFAGYTKANYTQVSVQPLGASTVCEFLAGGSGQVLATLSKADFTTGTNVEMHFSATYYV